MKKKLASLLVALMIVLFSFTGCLGHIFTTAMVIDGEEISSGMYLLMQYMAYNEATGLVEDSEADIWKQEIEGVKVTDWIQTKAEENLGSLIAVERMAAERSMELTEEHTEELTSVMEYYTSMESYYASLGVSRENFERYLKADYLKSQLFEELYAEDGEMAPTRQEVSDFYAEGNVHMRIILVSLVDPYAGGELENEEEVRALFDEMTEAVKSGEMTIQAAAVEYYGRLDEMIYAAYASDDEDTTGDTAGDATDEPIEDELEDETTPEDETTGEGEEEEEPEPDGIINYYLDTEENSVTFFTAEFVDKVKEEAVGHVDVYENEGSIMLYEVIEPFEKDSEYENVRETVVQEMKSEEFDDYLVEIGKGYSIEWFPLAQWYLGPKKQMKNASY